MKAAILDTAQLLYTMGKGAGFLYVFHSYVAELTQVGSGRCGGSPAVWWLCAASQDLQCLPLCTSDHVHVGCADQEGGSCWCRACPTAMQYACWDVGWVWLGFAPSPPHTSPS